MRTSKLKGDTRVRDVLEWIAQFLFHSHFHLPCPGFFGVLNVQIDLPYEHINAKTVCEPIHKPHFSVCCLRCSCNIHNEIAKTTMNSNYIHIHIYMYMYIATWKAYYAVAELFIKHEKQTHVYSRVRIDFNMIFKALNLQHILLLKKKLKHAHFNSECFFFFFFFLFFLIK